MLTVRVFTRLEPTPFGFRCQCSFPCEPNFRTRGKKFLGRERKRIESVKRTTDTDRLSRPLHGLNSFAPDSPALKCWATFIRPLRGLGPDASLSQST